MDKIVNLIATVVIGGLIIIIIIAWALYPGDNGDGGGDGVDTNGTIVITSQPPSLGSDTNPSLKNAGEDDYTIHPPVDSNDDSGDSGKSEDSATSDGDSKESDDGPKDLIDLIKVLMSDSK